MCRASRPVPWQVVQVACFGTVTETSVPFTAWSKLSRTSVSRSRPRIGSGWPGPPRPKIVEKMSPRSEVKPPPPAGPRPRPAPKPPNMPPESYSLRFSGSESVS